MGLRETLLNEINVTKKLRMSAYEESHTLLPLSGSIVPNFFMNTLHSALCNTDEKGITGGNLKKLNPRLVTVVTDP